MQEIAVCRKWVKLLEEKKFEEAARMVDYSKDYESILEAYEYHQVEKQEQMSLFHYGKMKIQAILYLRVVENSLWK